MKVYTILLMFLLVIGCSPKDIEKSETDYHAVINQSQVRLKTEPNLQSETIKILDKDDRVIVLAISTQRQQIGDLTAHWFKIKIRRKEGWIYGAYLDLQFDKDVLKIVNISPDGNKDDIVENLDSDFYGVYVNSDFEFISIFLRNDDVYISDGDFEWILKKNIDDVNKYEFNKKRNNIWIHEEEGLKYISTDRIFDRKQYNLIFQSENTDEIIKYFENQNELSEQLRWKWGIYYLKRENIAFHIKPEFSDIYIYVYTFSNSNLSIDEVFTTKMNYDLKDFTYNNINYTLSDLENSSNWLIEGIYCKFWPGRNLFNNIYDFAEMKIEQDLGFDQDMINAFSSSKYALFNGYSDVIIFSNDMGSILLDGLPFPRAAIFETRTDIDETRLDENLIGFRYIKTDGEIYDYENWDVKMTSDFIVTIYYEFEYYYKLDPNW